MQAMSTIVQLIGSNRLKAQMDSMRNEEENTSALLPDIDILCSLFQSLTDTKALSSQ